LYHHLPDPLPLEFVKSFAVFLARTRDEPGLRALDKRLRNFPSELRCAVLEGFVRMYYHSGHHASAAVAARGIEALGGQGSKYGYAALMIDSNVNQKHNVTLEYWQKAQKIGLVPSEPIALRICEEIIEAMAKLGQSYDCISLYNGAVAAGIQLTPRIFKIMASVNISLGDLPRALEMRAKIGPPHTNESWFLLGDLCEPLLMLLLEREELDMFDEVLKDGENTSLDFAGLMRLINEHRAWSKLLPVLVEMRRRRLAPLKMVLRDFQIGLNELQKTDAETYEKLQKELKEWQAEYKYMS